MTFGGVACSDQPDQQADRRSPVTWPRAELAALTVADSCDALTDHFHDELDDRVGPWGLDGSYDSFAFVGSGDVMTADAAMPATEAPMAESQGRNSAPATTTAPAIGGDGEVSETNVQEAGVDEPDVVKTDGQRLVTVLDGTLRVVDLTTPVPVEVGSLGLDGSGGHRLFLVDDRAVIVGGDWIEYAPAAAESARFGDVRGSYDGFGGSGTRVTVVDLSDPTAPAVVQAYVLDGDLSAARRIGDQVRIVTTANPQPIAFTYPTDGTRRSEARAASTNRQAVLATTATDWLPAFRTVDDDGALSDPEPLVSCDRIGLPVQFSGYGSVVVSTVGIEDATLDASASVAVLASDATVYASPQNLYVATNEWATGGEDAMMGGSSATGLHKFSIAPGAPAAYLASGQVEGRLLNQFAMSEHDSHLRVATTLDGMAGGGVPVAPMPEPTMVPMTDDVVIEPIPSEPGGPALPTLSDNAVHVLAQQGADLVTVGSVDGMGAGERIYSVRYLGDMGYVVTFRETDPLYTIDLSDPTNPRVLGELKIPGFSTYLHPTRPGRLVGIGQDATDTGQTTGLQVSLFDVSNPTDPRRTQTWTLPNGYSSAEGEHHAFLWWAADDLLVVPVSQYSTGFEGVVVLQVTDAGIVERGRIQHLPGVDAPTPCDVVGCPGVDPEPEPEPTTTTTVDPDQTTTSTTSTTVDPDPTTTTTVDPEPEPVLPPPSSTVVPNPDGSSPGVAVQDAATTEVIDEPFSFESDRVGGRPGPAQGVPIARAVIVGDTVITISSYGVKVSGLADLVTRTWLVFG